MNKFDPRKWLNIEKETKPTSPKTVSVTTSSSTLDDIETITQRIEASQLDITSGYAAWRDLGFALAEELGGSGCRPGRRHQDRHLPEGFPRPFL